MIDINKLIEEANVAFTEQERVNAENVWKEIAMYMLPYQDGGFSTSAKTLGQGVNPQVFDSTAIIAVRDLAAALHSSITNPAMQWSNIRFKDEAANEDMQAVAWLNDANDMIHKYLTESNFDAEIGKCYKSFVANGNFILVHDPLIENDVFSGFKFSALPVGSSAFCFDGDGKIDRFHRKVELSAAQIKQMFPDTCGEHINDIVSVRPLEKFCVFHCFKKREDYKKGKSEAEKRPVAEYYILEKTKELLYESGHYEMPVYVVRWETLPNETYGTGAGHVVLPDVKTLNTMQGDSLRLMAKIINPPIVSTIGTLMGDADLRPGHITHVTSLDGFKEMTTNARFDVAQAEKEQLRNAIKSAFFIDKLMLPPRTETGEMTAFEVSQRLEQMQQILAPTLSSLNSQFLSPFIVRCFRMLVRNGLIQIPNSLDKKFDDIDVVFVNPLARSQQVSELRNVQTFVNETAQMAQINPSVLDTINFDEVVYYSAKIRNIPEGILRSEEEVMASRKQQQEQAQQQQMMAAAEPLSNAVKNISQSEGQ